MLDIQVVPIPEMITNISGEASNAVAELIFKAEAIPPLGFKVFIAKYSADFIIPIYDTFHNEVRI